MALEDIFSFISAEERQKRSLAYQKEIFPLGMEQKEAAFKALRPLISPKIPDNELLFYFIVSKEKYIKGGGDTLQPVKNYLKKQKQFSEKDKLNILALILLDMNAKTIEEYPGEQEIIEKAHELYGVQAQE